MMRTGHMPPGHAVHRTATVRFTSRTGRRVDSAVGTRRRPQSTTTYGQYDKCTPLIDAAHMVPDTSTLSVA